MFLLEYVSGNGSSSYAHIYHESQFKVRLQNNVQWACFPEPYPLPDLPPRLGEEKFASSLP
ncbi:hypothetical protein DPMN_141057 [Dreissena polymorpha]|uniref:Uncharacterized protein n=1 Tax=Dreissena polymorpha TaxID=45954 RepID=A0A9D4GBZ4_DREPO|nr:hypothetical protein DPMN_141057 [Dreissena polymorpha]